MNEPTEQERALTAAWVERTTDNGMQELAVAKALGLTEEDMDRGSRINSERPRPYEHGYHGDGPNT